MFSIICRSKVVQSEGGLASLIITAGTCQDISFLIDFLPSYLYPHGERTVERWMLAGFSLGGHATWYALQHGEWFCNLEKIVWDTCLQSNV